MTTSNGRRRFLKHGSALAAALPLAPPAGWAGAGAVTATRAPQAATGGVNPRVGVLAELLARNRKRHPGLHGSNHVSMALLSLASLGGSEGKLRAYAEPAMEDWPRMPADAPPLEARRWTEHLGRIEALPGLRAMFGRQIAAQGVASTLRSFLPALLPGLGAHAFHSVIRTAYGVRFDDHAEVAEGLAYWAMMYLPLGTLAAEPTERDPARALAAIRAAVVPVGKLTGNIAGKMKGASAVRGFAELSSTVRPDGDGLTRIARVMAELYIATGSFAALHCVTGTQAYRVLEPFVPTALVPKARRHLWQALVAAYVSVGAPAVALGPRPPSLPSWDEIAAKAIDTLDEHDVKLVDIAREDERHFGDAIFRWAAARRMGLVAKAS